MKVAIVHEWLVNFRGSERVLLELARMFPEATIFASVLDRSQLPDELSTRDIRTTFIQKLPRATKWYQKYLPLMPAAYEDLDLSGYDLIISSSHSCAKGVIPGPNAVHVCYCYTPMRYAWSGYHEYKQSLSSGFSRAFMAYLMHRMRQWDLSTSSRVDHFVACSREIQRRIKRYYGRDSSIVFPPVHSVDSFDAPKRSPTEWTKMALERVGNKPYYLSLGRLVRYKRVDIAIDACSQRGEFLIVAGNGPELDNLKKRAGPTVFFLEDFSDQDSAILYKRCKAFLFPGEEDFGITVVEAQSFGKPVIAYGRGGALDTVVPGSTGVLFDEQTADGLSHAMCQFDTMTFEPESIRRNAARFSPEVFQSNLGTCIKSAAKRETNC